MSENLEKKVRSRSIQKHDLEVNWNKATSFIPYKGEFIIYDIEVDEDGNDITQIIDGVEKTVYELVGRTTPYTYERFKIGDGKTPVTDLPFTINAHNNIYYGVCETPAATQEKIVQIDNFILQIGSIVVIKFIEKNGVNAPTLNVSNTGAKPIYNYGTKTPTANNDSQSGWCAGAIQFFIYDGTGWIRDYWENTHLSPANEQKGFGFGVCTTATGISTKTVALKNYIITEGSIVSIRFASNVNSNATLSINNYQACPIYYGGSPIRGGTIYAGETATFMFTAKTSSTGQYILLAVDGWGAGYSQLLSSYSTLSTRKLDKVSTNSQLYGTSTDGTQTTYNVADFVKTQAENQTITGNLAITGKLQVQGTTETVDAVTYKIKNNVIEFNPEKVHNEAWLTGLAINKGLNGETDLGTYGIMYDPSTDAVKLGFGQVNEENKFRFNEAESAPIAIRDDSGLIQDGAIMIFDGTTNKLIDSGFTIKTFYDKILADIKTWIATEETIENNESGGQTAMYSAPPESVASVANEQGGDTLMIGGIE